MSDWKSIVSTVAPALATALGGPMAGVAVQMLGTTLLGDREATESQVSQAVLRADPDALVKLREADRQFDARMKELEIDIYRLDKEDRADARKLFSQNKWPQIGLSIVFIGGYFYLLFSFVSGVSTLDPTIKEAALMLIALVTREVPTIMQFWFGSSSGSKDKTQILKG